MQSEEETLNFSPYHKCLKEQNPLACPKLGEAFDEN